MSKWTAKAFDLGAPMPLGGQGVPRWSSTGAFGSAGGARGRCRAASDRAPDAFPSWVIAAPCPTPSCDACPGRVASLSREV